MCPRQVITAHVAVRSSLLSRVLHKGALWSWAAPTCMHPSRQAAPCLQMLGDVFSSLSAAVGAADKVVELMQQRPSIPHHGALQPADFAGTVELDSVAFSYPARPEASVLNSLSLKVNPGEVSAGLAACGSTMIGLWHWSLCHCDPQSGHAVSVQQPACGVHQLTRHFLQRCAPSEPRLF